jgi:hypothetical protein
MKAYLNKQSVKTKYVKRVKAHAEADQIIKGQYWEDDKGCAVGCTIEGDDHKRYETELGIPEWLARLEDTLFEGMPNKRAMKFPLEFLQSINVGADLEPVKWKFCAYLMSENIEQVLSLDIPDNLKKQVVDAIRGVLNLHETAIKTGEWDESAAASAVWSARSAAESAESAAESAWSAASAAASAVWSARSAAESAAKSAVWSAVWSAARSAVWSAARSAPWSATYERQADKLLEMLKAQSGESDE